jgi:secreted trypsin-like serine protease
MPMKTLYFVTVTFVIITTLIFTSNVDADSITVDEEFQQILKIHQNEYERKLRYSPRIIGGSPAPTNAYPWFVLLADDQFSFFCGGSLVAPDIVLTAAHCMFAVSPKTYASIRGSGELLTIKSMYIHPDYQIDNVTHDFMLLKLSSESIVTPVHMDPGSYSPMYVEGKSLWAAGFGDTDPDYYDVSLPNELQEVELEYISQLDCKAAYSSIGVIDDSMMCAGKFGKDSCQGDSGGPLYDKDNEVLTGVVSFGIGCADSNFPGVYGRIAEEWPWIQKTICDYSSSGNSTRNNTTDTMKNICNVDTKRRQTLSNKTTITTSSSGRMEKSMFIFGLGLSLMFNLFL